MPSEMGGQGHTGTGIRARFAARLRRLTGADAQERRLDGLQHAIDDLERRVVVGVHGAIDDLERRIIDGAHLAAAGDLALAQRIERTEDRAEVELSRLETLELIAATTAGVASLGRSDMVVSVVMPTRNRSAMLREAVASVQAQIHQAWELIVVDDASEDDTTAVLAELAAADDRIRPLRCAVNGGPSAARNLGLEHVRGPVVAYLDDDNLMAPSWLRAVVWAFAGHPDADVLYGARLVEVPDQVAPWIVLRPWNRRQNELVCLIDQNVLAHRDGLPEARQRDGILGEDWEMGLRLTRSADPLVVPVVATLYRTSHDERISKQVDIRVEWAKVQRQALRMRPLRVAGTRAAGTELGLLSRQGAITGEWEAPDGDAADTTELPDVVLLGADVGAQDVPDFERYRLPFVPLVPTARGERHAFSLGTPPSAVVRDEDGEAFHAWILDALDLWRARHAGFVAGPKAPDRAATSR